MSLPCGWPGRRRLAREQLEHDLEQLVGTGFLERRVDAAGKVQYHVTAAGEAELVSTACRVCGCTDERACDPPCWWVEDDLCSRCARPLYQSVVDSFTSDLEIVNEALLKGLLS